MTDILFLRGASAFSAFRLQGLQQRIQALVPGARIVSADYWHIVKLNATLDDGARRQLGPCSKSMATKVRRKATSIS